jgi:hypothetical protein
MMEGTVMQFDYLSSEWLDASKRFASRRDIHGDQEVLVGTDLSLLDAYVAEVWNGLDVIWSDHHYGQELPVSQEELRKYFFTAIRSRVQYVRGERVDIRGNENWWIPASMNWLVAQLGRVESEDPQLRIVPKLTDELIALSLPSGHDGYTEFTRIGQKLRRIESDEGNSVIFIHKLEKSREGNPKLMALLPRRDESGRLLEVRSKQFVDPIAASAYFIYGMEPEHWESVLQPMHPMQQPTYYQPWEVVKHLLPLMAQVNNGSGSRKGKEVA